MFFGENFQMNENLEVTPYIYMNGYIIRGYIDRGKFVVNLGCLYGPHLLVSSFVL